MEDVAGPVSGNGSHRTDSRVHMWKLGFGFGCVARSGVAHRRDPAGSGGPDADVKRVPRAEAARAIAP